jgi:hypothetical protein
MRAMPADRPLPADVSAVPAVPADRPVPADVPAPPDHRPASDQLDATDLPASWQPDDPVFEARVIRAFIRDGRLASIPARERKKLAVYRYLLDQVLPDPAEEVAERDLNMRLALWHPDVATIRRALIDLRFATRDGMTYRRAVPVRNEWPPRG